MSVCLEICWSVGLFECLSVRMLMNDNLQNVLLIYRVPFIVDCSVEDMLCTLLCIQQTLFDNEGIKLRTLLIVN